MDKKTLAQFLPLVAAFFAASTFTSCGAAPALPPPPPTAIHEFEYRMFELVNLERASQGLSPLVWHEALALVARGHSADMLGNNFLGHRGSDGSDGRQRIGRGGITNVRSWGANVSAGHLSPEAAFEAWARSDGGLPLILHDEHSHIGIGFMERPEGSTADFPSYWTKKLIRQDPLLSPEEIREFELSVLGLTNLERASYGLPPLVWHETLASIAREHSADMQNNNFIGHIGSDGSTLGERVERGGITNWIHVSENVARGQLTPGEVVKAWMNSPGHRANILYENSTHLGVGLVEWPEGSSADISTSWTQKFLRF